MPSPDSPNSNNKNNRVEEVHPCWPMAARMRKNKAMEWKSLILQVRYNNNSTTITITIEYVLNLFSSSIFILWFSGYDYQNDQQIAQNCWEEEGKEVSNHQWPPSNEQR